jgi:hypothetical protein
MIRTLLLLLFLYAFQSNAQLKALVGRTLIDGIGGKPILNSVIVIEGERIKKVGQQGQVVIPAAA